MPQMQMRIEPSAHRDPYRFACRVAFYLHVWLLPLLLNDCSAYRIVSRTLNGRRNEMDPRNTDVAPASNNTSTSLGSRMPPPALIGFVIPVVRAAYTHSATSGRSGAPESPPPPKCASGDVMLPNKPTQSIRSGSFPHGIVFEIQMPSQAGWRLISSAICTGSSTLNFGINGMSSAEAIFKPSSTSLASSPTSCPVFGQE